MHITLFDAAGLVGDALLLGCYALTVGGRLDPLRPAALLLNLFGALGILISLVRAPNLSVLVIESAWALIALGGLVRWGLRRRPGV